jgi:hypothetical protein
MPSAFYFFQFLPERRRFAHQFGDGLPQPFVGRFEVRSEIDRLTPGFGVIAPVQLPIDHL